jgi:microsomal dipeptidase-like Zn-dependent dipeptidase
MVGFQPWAPRAPGAHGEYIDRFDEEFGTRWRALGDWKEDPEADNLVPTVDDSAEHVDHVLKTVGADHVAIGLDVVAGAAACPRSYGLSRSYRRVESYHDARERAQDRRRELVPHPRSGASILRENAALGPVR